MRSGLQYYWNTYVFIFMIESNQYIFDCCFLQYKMGSRITRAVFRDQRNRPIESNRKQSIRTLTAIFLTFMSILAFFLYGYLYRPYLHLNQYLSLFLLIVFYLVRTPKTSPSLSILSGILLILVLIFTQLAGLGWLSIKGILILSTVLFAADSQSQLMPGTVGTGLLLWLRWQAFALGLSLSAEVQKHSIVQPAPSEGSEDAAVVRMVFSIIGLMGIYLVAMGDRIYEKKEKSRHQEVPKESQIVEITLVGWLLMGAFAFEHEAKLTLNQKMLAVALPFIVLLTLRLLNRQQYVWGLAFGLGIISFMLQLFTQRDEFLLDYLEMAKLVAANILMVEGVALWRSSSPTVRQPFLMLPIWFASFCCCWFWGIGSYLYEFIPLFVELSPFLASALLLTYHMRKQSDYSPIP